MEQQTTEEILVEYGIHLGYGEDRRALALDLEKGKLTGLNLRMVADHVQDQGSAKSAGVRIASLLKDKARRWELLADLREFHKYRHAKEAMMAEKKQEPGKGLREQDQTQRDTGTSDHFELTPLQLSVFKWQWTVADYRHRGHSVESCEQNMKATPPEQAEYLELFREGLTFYEALAKYAKEEKSDASKPGTD